MIWPQWNFGFTDIIEELTPGMVGREKQSQLVKGWLADRATIDRILWISGKPGVGKSSFMALLYTELRPECGKAGITLIPYFFRAGDSRCNSESFYQVASIYLARAYGIMLENEDKEPYKDRFDRLVGTVLQAEDKELYPGIVFILDGLDELSDHHAQLLDLPLTLKIPNIRWILAGRGECVLADKYSLAERTDTLWPDGELPALTPDDVRQVIYSKLPGDKYRLFSLNQESTGGDFVNNFIEDLVRKSEGFPVYIQLVIEDIKNGKIVIDGNNLLPEGLSGYYMTLMERIKAGDISIHLSSVLGILCWARQELSKQELKAILSHHCQDVASGWEDSIDKTLQRVSTVLKKALNSTGEPVWSLYHQSFREYLQCNSTTHAMSSTGRKILLEWCSRWAEHKQAYALRHYPCHLLENAELDNLYSLLTDLNFIESKCGAGLIYNLMKDYDSALTCGLEFSAEQKGSLREFNTWLKSQSHILKEHPASAFYLAVNQPDGTIIQKAAGEQWQKGYERPWLKWVNKPQYIMPCIMTIPGEQDYINTCGYSPDGKKIASVSRDRIIIWNAESGEQLAMRQWEDFIVHWAFSPDSRKIALVIRVNNRDTVIWWDIETGEDAPVTLERTDFFSFSPDSSRLVTVSYNHNLVITDIASGRELGSQSLIDDRSSDDKGVLRSCISPDGKHFASISSNRILRVWHTNNISKPTVFDCIDFWKFNVKFCVFSPDNILFICVEDDIWERDSIYAFDIDSGKIIAAFPDHITNIYFLRLSPDGTKVVFESFKYAPIIWDALTFQKIRTLSGHTGDITDCSFSPDSKWIVSASLDKTLRIWDIETGQELSVLSGLDVVSKKSSFSPDGRKILSLAKDNTIRVWDAQIGLKLNSISGSSLNHDFINFSSNDKKILTLQVNGTMEIWDALSGKRLKTFEKPAEYCCLSPDGQKIVSVDKYDKKTLRIWDVDTGQELAAFTGHSNHIRSCGFSPDGIKIATSAGDCTVRIWDAETGNCMKVLKYSSTVYGCCFSQDNNRIVCRSFEGTAICWEVNTGKQLLVLSGADNFCAFASHDERIVGISEDNDTLCLWDSATGEDLVIIKDINYKSKPLFWDQESVNVSADGKKIAVSCKDNSIRTWDAGTGKEFASLCGHTDMIIDHKLSPDGKRVLSVSMDKTLRIWNAENGREILNMYREETLNAVAWSPDGRRFAVSGSSTGRLYLYEFME